MQETIVDLQTRLAFQEEMLQSLNDTIAEQAMEIVALRQAVKQLSEQVKNLTPSLIASIDDEAPPPHY